MRDALMSSINKTYLNFTLLCLWNFLDHFKIWCRLSYTRQNGRNLIGLRKFHRHCRAKLGYVLWMGDLLASCVKCEAFLKFKNSSSVLPTSRTYYKPNTIIYFRDLVSIIQIWIIYQINISSTSVLPIFIDCDH